jgi:hypothetical protein
MGVVGGVGVVGVVGVFLFWGYNLTLLLFIFLLTKKINRRILYIYI